MSSLKTPSRAQQAVRQLRLPREKQTRVDPQPLQTKKRDKAANSSFCLEANMK